MKRLPIKKFNEILNSPELRSTSELLENEVYYIDKYARRGNRHLHYKTTLDKDFNEIRNILSRYSLDGSLQRIAKIDDKSDTLLAYDTEPINDEYMKVNRNDNALRILENMDFAGKPSWAKSSQLEAMKAKEPTSKKTVGDKPLEKELDR